MFVCYSFSSHQTVATFAQKKGQDSTQDAVLNSRFGPLLCPLSLENSGAQVKRTKGSRMDIA